MKKENKIDLKNQKNLKYNIKEKEKIKIIKKNYFNKRIFCYLCKEYTYINKFYINKDDIDNKIIIKYYCSISNLEHCCDLIDFLFQCCKNQINEKEVSKFFF